MANKPKQEADAAKIKQLTESISASLVREFLAKKGLRGVLKHFDSDFPRDDLSVSNRAHLIRLLHIERIIIKNQDSQSKVQTLLEIITKQLLYPTQQTEPQLNESSPPLQRTAGMTKRFEENSTLESTKFEKNTRKEPSRTAQNDLPTVSAICARLDDLEVCDLSDGEEDQENLHSGRRLRQSWISHPISASDAKDLKKILFGTHTPLTCFNNEWRGQAFTFNSSISYGFIQKKGGPCGLLAAVQAKLLQVLLFGDNSQVLENDKSLLVTTSQRSAALAITLSSILWKIGQEKKAIVVTTSASKSGVIESLCFNTFTSLSDIEEYFLTSIKQWECDCFDSCIAFLCSIILSCGIKRVLDDIDDSSSCIIGRHGYCTQEMVNLILQGRAFSNVFDGEMALNSMILKGIPSRSDIGLLSLFEHYNTCQVGSYYKNPVFPIWVVLSESHFTVLFSTVMLDDSSDSFELYYYDSLGRQDSEIRLSIEPEQGDIDLPQLKTELTPPLELCIRTKWKNASVTWHGSEPLL